MKELGFHSKYLIEILIEQYQLQEPIINRFDTIINDENNAFKIILFLTQLETLVSDENPEYRFNVLHGSCLFALELLTKNSSVNLFECFLNTISENPFEE